MKARAIHDWQITTAEAREWQTRLAASVIREDEPGRPLRLVAGVDIAVRRDGSGQAAVVVLTYPGMTPVETSTVEGRLAFPYVPGLLSYREAPLILTACEGLRTTPDLILVDGQGIAHPRRMGIASHLGLLLDVPTIGCAKSRLCGTHDMPAHEAGRYAALVHEGDVVGAVLRTKSGVKPLYISIGHRIGLETAVRRLLECCRGYRLPEPTRQAHFAAGRKPASVPS